MDVQVKPMRIYLFVLIVIFFNADVVAQQNLVPNGDFEDYIACPDGFHQIDSCRGWRSWSDATPDYFNACASGINPTYGVPVNLSGYQYPHSGNGYIGVSNGVSRGPVIKEYITRDIIPMWTGAAYEVSMSVNLSNNYKAFGTNDIGITFYDKGPGYHPGKGIIGVPHIEWKNIVVTDTQDWVRLTAIFVADSSYDNIAIGHFRTVGNIITSPPNSEGYCYYLLDSVVVKLYGSLAYEFKDTALCAGDTLVLRYSSSKKESANIFTMQLSDASGSFAFPVNIGSKISDTSGNIEVVIPLNTPVGNGYKIRMLASDIVDTSYESYAFVITNAAVSRPITNSNEPVCPDDTLHLSAYSSTLGVKYLWQGPNNFYSTLQNPSIPTPSTANSGYYFVIAYKGGCKQVNILEVVVHPAPIGTLATSNTPVCETDTVKLYGTSGITATSFTWTGPNNFYDSGRNITLPGANAVMEGDYILYASDSVCTSTDTINVVVKPIARDFNTKIGNPCVGEELLLTTSSTSVGTTFKWWGPNGLYSEDSFISITNVKFADSGEYTVMAILDGCSSAVSFPVNVRPMPEQFTVSTNSPLCAGSTLILKASSATPDVFYNWYGPGGYVRDTVISNASVAMSGMYVATAVRDGCKISDTVYALVKPMPDSVKPSNNSPIWEGEDLFINAGTSSTGGVYSWSGPNGYKSDLQNITIRTADTSATGWYVVHIDLDGCGFADSTFVEVNGIPDGDGLVLYPNPNDGNFIISGNVNTNEYLLLTITNILEQELYREGLQPVNNHIRHGIDVRGLPTGVYLLNVMTAKKIKRITFVVR